MSVASRTRDRLMETSLGYQLWQAPFADQKLAPILREFYQRAHRKPGQTFPIMSWRDVARQYVNVYETVLKSKGG